MFFRALFLLIGTIVGAGVFSLPYVFSQSGFLPSLIGLLFLGLITTVLNLFYGQIVLLERTDRQLPGYIRKYLGNFWSKVSLITLLICLNGALFAYVILSREFLALSIARLPSNLDSLWFYFLAVFLFWQGFRTLTKIQAFLVFGLLFLIVFIPFNLTGLIEPKNYFLISSRPLFFWGATLFALTGFSVIPEVEEVVRKKRHLLPKIIISGGIISVFIYFLFGFGVWGISGRGTTIDAFSGLVGFSPGLVRIGALVGLLALMTSFLALASAVKEVYFRDLKLNENLSRFLTIVPPFFGIFFPLGSFIEAISFIGAFGLAFSGSLICFAFGKIRPKFKWLAWLISAVFISGALFSF